MFDTHGAPVRAITNGKVVSRGASPLAFRSVRFPAPAFDELMKNPEAAAQLQAQQISVEEARLRYETEAPKEIVLQQEIVAASTEADAGDRTQAPPDGLETPPLSLSQFVATTESLASTAKREPLAVRGADPGAPVAAAPLNVLAPPPPETPSVGQATRADEDELNALKANRFDPVIRRKQ